MAPSAQQARWHALRAPVAACAETPRPEVAIFLFSNTESGKCDGSP